MNPLLAEYLPILIFLGIAVGWSRWSALALVRYRGAPAARLREALGLRVRLRGVRGPRGKFDVRFYLVAILFIIFDLEVAFLFPWAVSLGDIGMFGFWSMMVFLAVLTVGFIYEWRKGALEWE